MSMATIHAGAKDHPVTLQKKTVSRTPGGGQKETWDPPADEVELLASRSDGRGGESYEGEQKVGVGEVTWRIWYRDDINKAEWRLVDDYSGDIYDILHISMIGRRQELELLTEIKDNQ